MTDRNKFQLKKTWIITTQLNEDGFSLGAFGVSGARTRCSWADRECRQQKWAVPGPRDPLSPTEPKSPSILSSHSVTSSPLTSSSPHFPDQTKPSSSPLPQPHPHRHRRPSPPQTLTARRHEGQGWHRHLVSSLTSCSLSLSLSPRARFVCGLQRVEADSCASRRVWFVASMQVQGRRRQAQEGRRSQARSHPLLRVSVSPTLPPLSSRVSRSTRILFQNFRDFFVEFYAWWCL